MKRWIAPIVSVVLAIIVAALCLLIADDNRASVDAKQAEVALLQNKIDAAAAANVSDADAVIASATGASMARVAQDDEAVGEFLDEVMSWGSYADYNEIRNTLIEEWNLSPTGSFLSVFMPEVVNETMDGKDYNRIDMLGYNMSFESLESHLIGIAKDDYSYFSIVTVSTNQQGTEALGQVAFLYTIDSGGELRDLSAYPIS